MISTYPEFSHLDLKTKDEVMEFTRKYEPYSDFSFINLFSWNTNEKAGIAWLNGNLVIKLPDYLTEDKFIYSLIGVNELDKTVNTLLDDCKRRDLVPQIVILLLKHPENYAIAEDRNSFDYVYQVNTLAKLNGKGFKNKRNIINNTRSLLGSKLEFTTVNTISPKLRVEMLAVFKEWQKHTSQPQSKISLEYIAINRLFDNIQHFDLHITLCRLDGKLNGFSIHEIIDEIHTICHFEKSLNHKHSGAGAVLINEAAKSLMERSEIVNWEQDLGLPGLKKAKSSYLPTGYYRKYWISRGHKKS